MVLATEIERKEGEKEGQIAQKRATPNHAISFDSVSKRYYKELPLLENLSFDVDYGDLFVIIGPSGSGKSTVLQMASGLLSPDCGQITIDGHKLFPKTKKDKNVNKEEVDILRRYLISYLPQEDFLFESLTVFENVALPLDLCDGDKKYSKDRDNKVRRALEDVGIGNLGNRMIHEVSAGERRRCAIARALVRAPKILIADEPTASLDVQKTNELMKYLKTRQDQEGKAGRDKMAILIASHDVLELGPFANKIYEIRDFTVYSKMKNSSV